MALEDPVEGKLTILLLLLSRFSHVRLRATLQTAAHQAPQSLGFSRQEHWSGLTILDSLLKSRGITLLTNVYTVKAMVFPVVMRGCESWTIKKAECPRILCFLITVLEKTLERPLDCKEIKPVNLKRNQP